MADTQSYASRLASDDSLEAMFRDHRQEGISNCSAKWKEASRLKEFAARIQWAERDRNKLDDPNRKAVRLTLPETSRVLAAFSGKQIMQRVEREYIPRNQDAARDAEMWTKVDKSVHQACDSEQVDTAAFRDGPGIQGISWVRNYVDEWSYDKPRYRRETVPIWNMMWPATRTLNLADRGWQRWGSWWPQSTVRSRWPDAYDKIRMMIGSNQWSSIQQTAAQHSHIPWTGGPGNKPLSTADAYDPKGRCFWIEYEEFRELVTCYVVAKPLDPAMGYDEAYEIDRQRIVALADPATAPTAPPDPFEPIEMSSDELRAFKRQWLATHGEEVPKQAVARKQRMVYRYIYGCGDDILEHGDLEQGCFTFQALAAEVVELETETKYISLLADLVDAQKMVNYMMSALVRDFQINPKGGLIVEQGLFRDKNEALAAWTSWGGVVEVPRGRLSGGGKAFELIPSPTNTHTSKIENILALYQEAVTRLAGFNPAALGQVGNDIRRVSGEVIRQLADATMTSNAERIDALRLYRRESARIFMAFARILWDGPEDLIPYVGESDAYDDVLDPVTGQPTGERVLAIPPKEAWREDYWKEIAIEEVQPNDDALASFWDKVQTQVALLQAPMPDTGQPLFTAEDWVKIFPMPAAMRQKLLARVKQQQQKFAAEQAALAQAQSQQVAPMQEQDAGGGQPLPVQ